MRTLHRRQHPGPGTCVPRETQVTSLLRNDSRVGARTLYVDILADPQRRIFRLRHDHQHTALQAHDDLLARLAGFVSVLRILATDGAGDGAHCDCDITPGAGTDQAADPRARRSTENRTDSDLMGMIELDRRDLFNPALPDLRRIRSSAGAGTGGQGKREEHGKESTYETIRVVFSSG
jgi:hypothetical protein